MTLTTHRSRRYARLQCSDRYAIISVAGRQKKAARGGSEAKCIPRHVTCHRTGNANRFILADGSGLNVNDAVSDKIRRFKVRAANLRDFVVRKVHARTVVLPINTNLFAYNWNEWMRAPKERSYKALTSHIRRHRPDRCCHRRGCGRGCSLWFIQLHNR